MYEIHDVLENQRLNYNKSTVTADSENQILLKGKDTETSVRMGMSLSDKLEQSDIFRVKNCLQLYVTIPIFFHEYIA